MGLQPMGMGWGWIKADGDGWGRGDFCGDGVGMGLMSTTVSLFNSTTNVTTVISAWAAALHLNRSPFSDCG